MPGSQHASRPCPSDLRLHFLKVPLPPNGMEGAKHLTCGLESHSRCSHSSMVGDTESVAPGPWLLSGSEKEGRISLRAGSPEPRLLPSTQPLVLGHESTCLGPEVSMPGVSGPAPPGRVNGRGKSF